MHTDERRQRNHLTALPPQRSGGGVRESYPTACSRMRCEDAVKRVRELFQF